MPHSSDHVWLPPLARTAGSLFWSILAAPPPRRDVFVRGSGPDLTPGRPLTILVWNIQFAGGRDQQFFYDGGPGVHVSPEVVRRTLDRIGAVIAESDADLVLLQEVDRSSARTGRIDQHTEILRRVPYPIHGSTPYHRNPYVPHPPHAHLGRIDMHLSVFSRHRIARGIRWQLPRLREPWIRRQFNLRRALLQLELPTHEGDGLTVFNTHLSAFSRGDGTLPRQVAAIETHLDDADARHRPWLLAGDFNALPPTDVPDRLGAMAALYADRGSPIASLFDRSRGIFDLDAHAQDPQRYRTFLPHGSNVADRAIDHAFASRGIVVHDAEVLDTVTDVGDHLPIRFTIRVP